MYEPSIVQRHPTVDPENNIVAFFSHKLNSSKNCLFTRVSIFHLHIEKVSH